MRRRDRDTDTSQSRQDKGNTLQRQGLCHLPGGSLDAHRDGKRQIASRSAWHGQTRIIGYSWRATQRSPPQVRPSGIQSPESRRMQAPTC